MKGFSLIVWVGIAGLASVALFNITFKVEQIQDELNVLNKQILQEQKAVHVLQAEWSYLSRPERIEALSQRLLPHLQPPTAQQVGNMESLTAAVTAARVTSNPAPTRVQPAAVRGTR
ncbi:MAG: hypothetical protein GKS00_00920 [Alphaproteobacteria bacterium]|nr:hypothetical protein [Alphaproteobacteria bacterium]